MRLHDDDDDDDDWSEEEEEEDVEKALQRNRLRKKTEADVKKIKTKACRVGMRLERRLNEDVVAQLVTVASLQIDGMRRTPEIQEETTTTTTTTTTITARRTEADELEMLRTAVRKAEAAFLTCRREYAVYQRSLVNVYAPRELAEERRRRDKLKRDIERAAEKLQDAKFTLSKMEDQRRRLDVAKRRKRNTTAPPIRVPSRSTSIQQHPNRRDDDSEIGHIAGLNATYMSTPQLIARAKTVMRRDTLALKRGVVMVEEMKSIGAATAAELHRQAAVMRAVDGVVDDASHDLKTAGRAITYLMRGVHFDRCQKLMIALCLLGLAAVIIITATKWTSSAHSSIGRGLSTTPWTAHEALSSTLSGHVSFEADSVVDDAMTDEAVPLERKRHRYS